MKNEKFHDNKQVEISSKPSVEEIFPTLQNYFDYLYAVLGRSDLTIKEYRYDLLQFFRYLLDKKRHITRKANISPKQSKAYDYTGLDLELINQVQLHDLYAFLAYLKKEKNASSANRSRKIACLRNFFSFLYSKVHLIHQNPAAELESPKQSKRHPKYLEMDESIQLLKTAAKQNTTFSERDYCILTLFLNCGLRLSELCALNVEDWKDNHLRVIGKGNKERLVYLNHACLDALHKYMDIRSTEGVKDKQALFISRQKNRIAKPTVQLMVKKQLAMAGLDAHSLSTHKLRHTAATLMYKYGEVDIRTLQQILGHSSVSTTEIYTHLDQSLLEKAMSNNPLSEMTQEEIQKFSDSRDEVK